MRKSSIWILILYLTSHIAIFLKFEYWKEGKFKGRPCDYVVSGSLEEKGYSLFL